MNTGLVWLAGFIIGAFTLFLVTAIYVYKPRIMHLVKDRDRWRSRAIEAETGEGLDPDWVFLCARCGEAAATHNPLRTSQSKVVPLDYATEVEMTDTMARWEE